MGTLLSRWSLLLIVLVTARFAGAQTTPPPHTGKGIPAPDELEESPPQKAPQHAPSPADAEGAGGAPKVAVAPSTRPGIPSIAFYVPKKRSFKPNGFIWFDAPRMGQSAISAMLDAETENTYESAGGAIGNGRGMGHGSGKGSGRSGWGGNGTGVVRFFHLQHGGANWDDGLTDGKDSNLLREWKDRDHKTGGDLSFAPRAQAITVGELRRYVKGKAPPVIFITGDAEAMSDSETAVVRDYLVNGGMLFADPQDNWQPRFTRWVTQRLFPNDKLIPIDNRQDPIFDGAYYFPGPTAFWSGNKSFFGIKRDGRWMVIYDRGRMAEGWNRPVNEDCIRMAINVMDYAFTQYANPADAPGKPGGSADEKRLNEVAKPGTLPKNPSRELKKIDEDP